MIWQKTKSGKKSKPSIRIEQNLTKNNNH
jgi:hypothetical protein